MEKELIGHVIDYFAKIGVAAIEVESGEIRVGILSTLMVILLTLNR